MHLVPNEPRGGRKAIVALNAMAAAIATAAAGRRLGMHIRAMPAARVTAPPQVHAPSSSSTRRRWARPGLARAAMQWADRVVAVSGYARDLALDAGAPEDRIRLLHPGVTPATQTAPPPSARPGPRTFVTVSRLDDRYKGDDVVLEPCPRSARRYRMSALGRRRRREAARRPAAARTLELGVDDAVDFRGNVSDDERDAVLRSAHAFCMPSRRPEHGIGEGFGIVYLEAGASDLPGRSRICSGVVDAVRDGVSGVLVDPAEPGGGLGGACAGSRRYRTRRATRRRRRRARVGAQLVPRRGPIRDSPGRGRGRQPDGATCT